MANTIYTVEDTTFSATCFCTLSPCVKGYTVTADFEGTSCTGGPCDAGGGAVSFQNLCLSTFNTPPDWDTLGCGDVVQTYVSTTDCGATTSTSSTTATGGTEPVNAHFFVATYEGGLAWEAQIARIYGPCDPHYVECHWNSLYTYTQIPALLTSSDYVEVSPAIPYGGVVTESTPSQGYVSPPFPFGCVDVSAWATDAFINCGLFTQTCSSSGVSGAFTVSCEDCLGDP